MKYALLLLPLVAQANEADLACKLEQAAAEVQASVLAAPAAFATVGDSVTSEKNVAVGISQSLSGRQRAALTREAAVAKCSAIQANVALDQHGRWSVANVKRSAAQAQLALVEQAISLAKTNIAELDAQLAAQTITIAQHTEARSVLVNLEQTQSELLRIIATPVYVVEPMNLTALAETSRRSEASAARLAAQAQSQTGWDVVVSAGMRQSLTTGQSTPYAAIALKYSFGTPASTRAAGAVGGYTEALLVAQQGGYTQTIVRQREELTRLVDAETLAVATTARQVTHLQRVRASIVGIDTALALNTLRGLDIQLLVLKAEQVGAQLRLNGYNTILEKLQ